MDTLKLVIDEFISVNHYLAYRTVMKGKKPMAISYKTKETKDFQKKFEAYVAEEIKKQKWTVPVNSTQHFVVEATYYFPRIDMDSNNYWKVPLDSITNTQLIWEDDNVVCERCVRILYDAKNPRIEWNIYPTEYTGIFDNKGELSIFKDKCNSCSRSKRNCSILKKAMEGRIQEEICGLKCSKFKQAK